MTQGVAAGGPEDLSSGPLAVARPHPRRGTAGALVLAAGIVLLTAGAVTAVQPGAAATASPTAPRPGLEIPVTAMDQAAAPANNSPTVLADPDDRDFVVLANRLDAPDFSCALHVSGNGGRGWAQVTPVPVLPDGAEKCYAPEVAFDRNGVLHYLFVGLAGAGNEPMGAFLTSSSDRGRTFTPPRQVLGPLNFAVRMVIDRDLGNVGRLHLTWIQAGADPPLGGFPAAADNPLLAAYSDDGGRSFSKPVRVSDPGRPRVVAPSLSLGAGHRVHIAYYDLGDDAVDYQGLEGGVWDRTWSVLVSTSEDAGRTFAAASVAEPSVVPPERVMLIFTMTPPALAVHGDRVCVAWTDARHGDPDVFARCSLDGGRRWGGARRINDDPEGNGLHQFMPRLAFSPDGRLDAVFYDRRREPRNVLNYVYLAFSADAGRSWARNVRLTRHASSSTVGQRYANASAKGQVEFGSRLGLLSRGRTTLAAWADTRNSRPDTTAQDIFTSLVSMPAAGEGSGRRAAGLGVTAAGAVAVAGGWRLRRRGGTPDGGARR